MTRKSHQQNALSQRLNFGSFDLEDNADDSSVIFEWEDDEGCAASNGVSKETCPKPSNETNKDESSSKWASLFPVQRSETPSTQSEHEKNRFDGLEFLFQPVEHLQPRGLLNRGNMCFFNAVLSSLLYCRPLYNLIKYIQKSSNMEVWKSTPLVEGLIFYLMEFKKSEDNSHGEPFVPDLLFKALSAKDVRGTFSGESQEDAEEFFRFLLDELEKELSKMFKDEISDDDDEWIKVQKHQRKARTVRIPQKETVVSLIFQGSVETLIRFPGRPDRINAEPFIILPLDIESSSINTIEDSLYSYCKQEKMDQYYSKSMDRHTTLLKQSLFDSLPAVLILSLKRISYHRGYAQKLDKFIQYPEYLDINRELISSPQVSNQYRLFSVVYHHGRDASGGHYTCDVRQYNNQWLHIDDCDIDAVSASQVVVRKDGMAAYLLLYEKI